MTRRRRVILMVFGATVLAGVVAAVVVPRIVLRDTAAPASLEDALARYRAAAARAPTPIPAGVYVYSTIGSESVSALGGATHVYPQRSTITVTEAPCGVMLRWDVLQTRSTTWRVCARGPAPVVQRLRGWTERHQFFGQDDSTTWSCGDSGWLVAGAAGTTSPYRCDSTDTVEEGRLVVVGSETIDVGGAAVGTVHIRIAQDERGDGRGRIVEERWLERRSGLPVRLRSRARSINGSPLGDVTFTERYDLTLNSLEPRT